MRSSEIVKIVKFSNICGWFVDETMNGKFAYERFVYHHGVKIKHYIGDNIWYNEIAFIKYCEKRN